MRRHASRQGGFSLVEIALALAVLAIAIVGLLGLLGVASKTTAENNRDTLLVAMSGRVSAELRAVPFPRLWQANPRLEVATEPGGSATPAESVYFFDANGLLLEGEAGAAAYRCTVRKTPERPIEGDEGQPAHLLRLQFIFQWPASGAAQSRNSQTVYAAIARY